MTLRKQVVSDLRHSQAEGSMMTSSSTGAQGMLEKVQRNWKGEEYERVVITLES
jgi:hypothetical protein